MTTPDLYWLATVDVERVILDAGGAPFLLTAAEFRDLRRVITAPMRAAREPPPEETPGWRAGGRKVERWRPDP